MKIHVNVVPAVLTAVAGNDQRALVLDEQTGVQVGATLVLCDKVRRRVTHIMRGLSGAAFGLEEGFLLVSIRPLTNVEKAVESIVPDAPAP